MKKSNFLLGRAERMVKRIPPPKIKPDKVHPYTFERAQERISPQLVSVSKDLSSVPAGACPNDEAVALITLNPAYLAKSYFPDTILSEAQLRSVGSRQRMIVPDAVTGKKERKETLTAELFVAGKRSDFKKLSRLVPTWTEEARGALDLRKIEEVRCATPSDRVLQSSQKVRHLKSAPLWEVVLHANALDESDYILDGFRDYLKDFDIKVNLDDRIHAQGLCFMPVRIPRDIVNEVAAFSFLRVAREVPKMRLMKSSQSSPEFKVDLPDADVVDPTIRVAIFDGGLPASPDLSRWSTRKKADGVAKLGNEMMLSHGLGVTSAFLFGPLEKGVVAGRPYAKVDHYRVLDEESANDDHREYFEVIKRIRTILENGRYEYINLSIGPDLPIEDDEIHVWTAILDQYLKKGSTFAGIAVGNDGERDHASGNARIQTPADCVNGMAFGSASCLGDGWERSPHSCIGRGRSPGVVKPDALCFGGSDEFPFNVLGLSGKAIGRIGTSFATPLGLRSAVGVRAILGPVMSPLAIKSLLIHRCENVDCHPLVEAGWGKLPDSIDELITCDDASAFVVYQGELEPGAYVRAPIPIPAEEMAGKVEIRSTICFVTETDPQDSLNYTRSGLEVTFRPHDEKKKDKKQTHPDSKSFFSAKNLYATEFELRSEAHMWETALHARNFYYGSSLKDPVFDIHYNARTGGGKPKSPQNITYAMIVSVHAPKVADLYDRIVRRYRTLLEAFRPVVEVTIRH